MMVQDNFITKIVTLGFLLVLFILGFILLKSIIIAVILGVLLAYILHPVFKKINKYIKSKDLSAILLIFGLLLIVAIPLWFLIPILIKQSVDIYVFFQEINLADLLHKSLPSLFDENFSRILTVHLNNILSQAFNSFLNEITIFIVNLPNFLLQFVVFLFSFYFAVRDAEKLKEYLLKLSPFSESTEKQFVREFRGITNAIVYGQFFIAVIQGIALGIGLFILGVPKALILTIIGIFTSMIPVLGAWLVWLPVGIVLLLSGKTFSGIAILLYGGLIVSSLDNILRILFLGKFSKLPIVVSLIGLIGGLYAFGLAGLILGPLILAYILIVLDFYRQGKLNELFKK